MAQAALKTTGGMSFEEDEAEREPFAAYLSDDASTVAAKAVAEQRGWAVSNIRKGGLSTALRLLGVAPPPRFMIVDIDGEPIDEVEQGLIELTRLGSQVMALGSTNDVNYFRRIMRAGVRDYLVKPIDADILGEVFVRLEQPGDGAKPLGRVVGFLGARGGVGVTTLAINTAWMMAEKLSRRTALVDMDIYSGNIALALDIEPTRGLREAFDDPERVDEVFLQNAMAKFGKSLHVLATEEAFDDAVRMTDDKVLDAGRHDAREFRHVRARYSATLRDARSATLHPVRRHRDRLGTDAAEPARHQSSEQAAAVAQSKGEDPRHREPGDREAGREPEGVRGRDGDAPALHFRRRHQGDGECVAQGAAAGRGRAETPDGK